MMVRSVALAVLALTVVAPLAAEPLNAGLSRCAAIGDDALRLACFDQLAGALQPQAVVPAAVAAAPAAAVAAPVAPAVPAVPATTVEPAPVAAAADPVAEFGLENRPKPQTEVERQDEIQARVVERKKDPYGKWILTLDNGQVWQQSESATFSFASDQVVIERGMLGAFYLKVDGQSRRLKVKRLK